MKASEVLLLGSTCRQTGKTGLACEVIRNHAGMQPMCAVKVTTIRDGSDMCPRGGDGCGVCHAFDGRFSLDEIHDGPPGKDTTRLLQAGASRVFWLRVREEFLAEAVAAAYGMVPTGQPSVWESNSVRQVMDPGLFLILRDPANPVIKDSCRRVMDLADQVVNYSATAWCQEAGRIRWSGARWTRRQAASALVLAGGRSLRMGQDKNFLQVKGRPMIGHVVDQLDPWFDEVLIGADDSVKFAFLNRRVVPDREKGKGPLMGLLSCLVASRHDVNFVTACDIPQHDPHFLNRLVAMAEGYDIVMPQTPQGDPEPLLAIYRRSVAPVIEQVLRSGGRRFTDLLGKVRVRTVPIEGAGGYRNLNTPGEYMMWVKEMDA